MCADLKTQILTVKRIHPIMSKTDVAQRPPIYQNQEVVARPHPRMTSKLTSEEAPRYILPEV